MTGSPEDDNLEKARARLEAALSRLAHGVANSQKAMHAAQEAAGEKPDLMVRISTLEEQNLKLHEEVASLTLQSPKAANDDVIDTLKQEKAAIEQNYMLLKKQYMNLQDQLDASENTSSAAIDGSADAGALDALRAENADLKANLRELQDEKDGIKARLDASIGKLEELLGA